MGCDKSRWGFWCASSLGFFVGGPLGIIRNHRRRADPDRTTEDRSGRGASGFGECPFNGMPDQSSSSLEQGRELFVSAEGQGSTKRMAYLSLRFGTGQGAQVWNRKGGPAATEVATASEFGKVWRAEKP